MNPASRKPGLLAAAVFYSLMIVLFPVSLLGYVIWVGRLMLGKREQGVSITAQGPLTARWTEHKLGVRPDEAASRLLPVLPNIPPLGLLLTQWPLLLAHRLTGFVPKTFRVPFEGEVTPLVEASARQTFFDAVVARYLPGRPQLVILGAGLDTRAYGLPQDTYGLPQGSPLRAFEVDTPQTQRFKRRMLEKAGIDAGRVTFVSADFEQEDWLARLVAAGFDPTRPALFLWEGVTMYLDRAAIEDTLRKIAGTAAGSMLAFDYFTREPLESQALYWRYGRATTRYAGEPLRFGFDSQPPVRENLAAFLHTCGLALVEHQTLGQETEGQRAWGGFALAEVKEDR